MTDQDVTHEHDGMFLQHQTIAVKFRVPQGADPEPYLAHLNVLAKAMRIYIDRNPIYNDNWKRMGWRGCLVRLRERAERLWDGLWDSPELFVDGQDSMKRERQLDDAYDLINFAAFLVRGAGPGHESTRDGEWWG